MYRVQRAEQKLRGLKERIAKVNAERVEPDEVSAALSSFEPVWGQLTPKEQQRVLRLLVERVEFDGSAGTISITFRPGGIKALAREQELAV